MHAHSKGIVEVPSLKRVLRLKKKNDRVEHFNNPMLFKKKKKDKEVAKKITLKGKNIQIKFDNVWKDKGYTNST